MMKLILTVTFLNMIFNNNFFLKKFNFLSSIYLMTLIVYLIKNNLMNNYWCQINLMYGMDFLSMNLCFLTLWIMPLSILSNYNLIKNYSFMNIMMLLTNILILCFCSMNVMTFFIFFEFSLIPMIIIIMGWGYQIDRIQASMYMLFYTLTGSMPLLLTLMYMYNKINTLLFNTLWMMNFNTSLINMMIFSMLMMAFLVKMPMYMVHFWLPKAHVEAPISGSMILAGIMLKLGSYGLYRSLYFMPKMSMMNNFTIIIFSMIGSLLISLMCLNQNDLKMIVAYSSVVHMNIMISGMFLMNSMSMNGSLMMMIGHGFCSPAMFYLVNLNYERLFSRSIFFNKGMINVFPSLTLWWFLVCSSNFSAPPSLNLFSEMLLFNSMIQWSNYMIYMIIFISFFSTTYSIFLYAHTQMNKMNYMFFNFKNINCLNYLILLVLWMPLNLMFINMIFFF